MLIVDCKGMQCPLPLIQTKKAIKSNKPGQLIEIQIDNENSCTNIVQFLTDNSITSSTKRTADHIAIQFHVPEMPLTKSDVETYCVTSPQVQPSDEKGNYILVLNSIFMGVGNDDLGKILLKGFLNAVLESTELPKEIICYNSAVTLAVKSTDTAETLKKFEDKGVRIMLCGTCVDFYSVKDSLMVGKITNMYDIAQKLISDRIVHP